MSAGVGMLGSWDELEEGKLENIFVAEGGFRGERENMVGFLLQR